MSARRSRRALPLLVAALASALAMAACSSDSGSDSSTSLTAYCEAIQRVYDTASPYATASTFPPDVRDQIGEELFEALKVAPPEVRDALGLAIVNGDSYARDDYDEFNRSNCNIDTASISAR